MSTFLPTGVTAGQYDKAPVIELPTGHDAWQGPAAWQRLADRLAADAGRTMAIDTYPGSDLAGLRRELAAAVPRRRPRSTSRTRPPCRTP